MALKRVSEIEDTSGLTFSMDYPNLTGFNVYDKNRDDVGEVQDMLYDTETSTVEHAIVGRGWLASLFGAKQVIVPFERMTVNANERKIYLDITRDELSRFPEWQEAGEEGLREKVSSWWRETRRAA